MNKYLTQNYFRLLFNKTQIKKLSDSYEILNTQIFLQDILNEYVLKMYTNKPFQIIFSNMFVEQFFIFYKYFVDLIKANIYCENCWEIMQSSSGFVKMFEIIKSLDYDNHMLRIAVKLNELKQTDIFKYYDEVINVIDKNDITFFNVNYFSDNIKNRLNADIDIVKNIADLDNIRASIELKKIFQVVDKKFFLYNFTDKSREYYLYLNNYFSEFLHRYICNSIIIKYECANDTDINEIMLCCSYAKKEMSENILKVLEKMLNEKLNEKSNVNELSEVFPEYVCDFYVGKSNISKEIIEYCKNDEQFIFNEKLLDNYKKILEIKFENAI